MPFFCSSYTVALPPSVFSSCAGPLLPSPSKARPALLVCGPLDSTRPLLPAMLTHSSLSSLNTPSTSSLPVPLAVFTLCRKWSSSPSTTVHSTRGWPPSHSTARMESHEKSQSRVVKLRKPTYTRVGGSFSVCAMARSSEKMLVGSAMYSDQWTVPSRTSSEVMKLCQVRLECSTSSVQEPMGARPNTPMLVLKLVVQLDVSGQSS